MHLPPTVKYLLLAMCLIVGWCLPALALEPDQIALVVNGNVPDSLKLAQFYAEKRGIPDHRIITLDLPSTDDISFDAYERNVVPVVRQYLRENSLDKKITCLVTFYGIPLRIRARVNTDADKAELADIQKELAAEVTSLKGVALASEKLANGADPFFKPTDTKDDLESLAQRAQTALGMLRQQIQRDQQQHQAEQAQQLTEQTQQLLGPIAGTLQPKLRRLQALDAVPDKTPEQSAEETQLTFDINKLQQQFSEGQDKRYDPDARKQMRELAKANVGDFEYARLLKAQIDYFDTADTESAVDNELPLLWWNGYARAKWQPNSLNYAFENRGGAPTLMVCRLDGPTPDVVRSIVVTSMQVEHDGLKGGVVLDGQGIAPKNPNGSANAYGEYDQTIRDLASLIRAKTKLTLLQDDKPALLPPGSAKDVAVYCGWHSVSQYIRCCTFNPGAVGFHVASLEMVSLHSESRQWCRNLLLDGVVATLGPVSEPYLSSFPRADDFFPLLFTGKLPMAEVYWKTAPMTSWRQTFVGDPLYTPYKVDPAIRVEDLPDRLRVIFAVEAPGDEGTLRGAPQ